LARNDPSVASSNWRLVMAQVKDASRRWMYGRKRPNRVAALLNRGTAALVAAGIGPKRIARLEVRGRRTGRRLAFPVVIAEYDGQRYLVAMLGKEANWVRNVRAAGGKAALRHGRREDVVLEEVDPSMRAPILQRYLEVAPGGRAHFPIDQSAPLEQFEQIAEQYPVFRIRVG
jgi:deazaflavin-dependent oxidoreductase (nitroreductase family)